MWRGGSFLILIPAHCPAAVRQYEYKVKLSAKTETDRMVNGMQLNLRKRQWLLPAVLILFILEVFTLPFVLGITYSGRSETVDHVLTYTENRLSWDSPTGIRADGTAELSLFDSTYANVQADNGDKVVAPGTEGGGIVRLKNSVSVPVTYTAVLYEIKDNPNLAVEAGLTAEGAEVVGTYRLPDSVEPEQVVQAVTGTVGGGEIQDFDINWLWQYYESDAQDKIDTAIGNKATVSKADEVTVGLYITVEDNNSYITPDAPQTGDHSAIGMYFGLMAVSAVVLLLLLISRRHEKKCGE